ncbi:MAG: hypothetical protein KGP01_04810 [Actinomycetales bacterium]|nr:hypothetical protein [Actinomycetales bacterium]
MRPLGTTRTAFLATSLLALVTVGVIAPAQAASRVAPGFPGDTADWRPAGKEIFTTAYGSRTSRVWLTGQYGILSEVFYPDLSTPALRELDFVVLDGRGHATKVSVAATHSVTWTHSDAPNATFISTSRNRTWRLTTTYTTDASRAAVGIAVGLVDTGFPAQAA